MIINDRTVAIARTTGTKVRPAGHRLVWLLSLIELGVLVSLLGVVNADSIAAAVRVWWISPTYSHCFLVIPISAYFIWRRRAVLAGLEPRAYPLALLLAVPLVLFSLAGRLANINEVQQLAFVGLLQVLIIAVLGVEIYRKILFPSLFLFFLVPMGEYLVVPLQHFTSQFISVGLTLFGIVHHTDGNFISLSNGIFEVAEACAGLRFLVATIAMGVLFVHLNYRKWHKIVLYLAASLIIPVIANGFRALGIVLVAHWSDNRIAHGVDHIVYGWGFLVVILLTLMMIGMRYADPIRAQERGEAVVAPATGLSAFLLTALLSLAAISFAPMALAWLGRAPHVDTAAFSAPLMLPPWQTVPVSSGWRPDYAVPDARLAFAMREADFNSADVDVFVNYYSGENAARRLIDSANKVWVDNVWHSVSQGAADAVLGGRTIHLNESVISSAGLTRLVWWTYWTASGFTTSRIYVKIEPLKHALSRTGGVALVAVSTPVMAGPAEARARLRRALGALNGVTARLDQAGRR